MLLRWFMGLINRMPGWFMELINRTNHVVQAELGFPLRGQGIRTPGLLVPNSGCRNQFRCYSIV
jgi:hypothetical protein